MKHFYLIINKEKPGAGEMADYISGYLEERGAFCRRQDREETKPVGDGRYTDASRIPAGTECILTLGGDGTLIKAARDVAGMGFALAGINLGHLGYLAQVSREDELGPVLDELLADHCRLESRMMIEGRVYRGGEPIYQGIALNDIVITRKDALRVLKYQVYVNDSLLGAYTADGGILATPTGSTAYNLSAGGPIVAPNAEVIILTPICPHTLTTRSLVLSSGDRIRIQVMDEEASVSTAVFDGDTVAELSAGDWIEISRSQISTTLVKLKDISFLDNLRNKMSGI